MPAEAVDAGAGTGVVVKERPKSPEPLPETDGAGVEDFDTEGVDDGVEAGELYGFGVELGVNLGVELGVKLGVERGVDFGVEAGVDLGVERGVELGVDRGVERGVLEGLKRELLRLERPKEEPGRLPLEVLASAAPHRDEIKTATATGRIRVRMRSSPFVVHFYNGRSHFVTGRRQKNRYGKPGS